MKKNPYKCRIYVRVSTKKQADKTKGSLKDQLRICREAIAEKGWTENEGEIYRDKDSGQTTTRDGLELALKEAETGSYNVLVVYDFDRLARSAGDCINLVTRDFLNKGVQVYSHSQKPELDPPDKIDYYSDDRLLRLIFSAFKSSADINKMRQKYNEGMLNKINNGYLAHPATPPYGYRSKVVGKKTLGSRGQKVDWKISIYEPEAKVVRRIYNDYLSGKSYRRISYELTDEGIPTPRNKKYWNYSTVKLILENPTYAQQVRWQWKKTPVPREGQKVQPKDKWIIKDAKHHPGIIDLKKFKAVERLMESKARLPGRSSQGKSLLSGIIKCSHCGNRMWATSETKTAQAYYVCSTWHQFRKCVSNFVPMNRADNTIIEQLLSAIEDEKQFISAYDKTTKGKQELPDALKLQKEMLDDLETERKRIRHAYRKKIISLKDLNDEIRIIDTEMEPIIKTIEKLEKREKQKKSAEDVIKGIKKMGDVRKHLEKNKPILRTYILDLLEDVEATKKGRGQHTLKINYKSF